MKDKASGLPKKYVSGLSKATAKARAAHWKKMAKYSDRDPRAYEPAPGDKTAKTKLSKYTKKYREMFGEEVDEACWTGYTQKGMKKKGKKMVPNCVPESVSEEGGAGEEGTTKLVKKYMKDTPNSKKVQEATKLKKKYLGKLRGKTETGKRANAINMKPTVDIGTERAAGNLNLR